MLVIIHWINKPTVICPAMLNRMLQKYLELFCLKKSQCVFKEGLGTESTVREKARQGDRHPALRTDGHTSPNHQNPYILFELNEAGGGYHLSSRRQERSDLWEGGSREGLWQGEKWEGVYALRKTKVRKISNHAGLVL